MVWIRKNGLYFMNSNRYYLLGTAKVPILKQCHFRKMKLWRVEHFCTYFAFTFCVITEYNSNHAQKWRQNMSKSVQPVRVSFFRNDILSKLVLYLPPSFRKPLTYARPDLRPWFLFNFFITKRYILHWFLGNPNWYL